MRPLSAMSLLIVVVVSSSAISAQSSQSVSSASIPRLINISGVFQPANGQPASAVETLTLSIYADSEGGALEYGAQPLGVACAKHRSGNTVSLGRAEQQRVAALRVDREGLRLLPEGSAALRVGIDRQRHRLDGAGRLPVGGLEDAADIDQARNRWG